MRTEMARKDYSGHHISEEDMEFYVRTCPSGGQTPTGDPLIDHIEAHLVICEQCRNGLRDLDDLRTALRDRLQ